MKSCEYKEELRLSNKLFYVYKIKWNEYSESRGMIVKSSDWKRAKGIAMESISFKGHDRNNVDVEELNEIKEGIICHTDYVENDESCN